MNLTFLALLVILKTGTGFILEPNAPRNVSKILTVKNGAQWGGWGPSQFCATGTYALGYALKMEANQNGGDDTTLNSIELICKGLDAVRFGGIITSLEGPFGRWTGQVECSRLDGTPRFLSAFALQVEPDQRGGDDTAANFLKFQCRDFAEYTRPTELSIPPGHGLFGPMGSWSPSCPANSAICGLKTRVEGNQGGGDDTALNDVIFYCCNEGDF